MHCEKDRAELSTNNRPSPLSWTREGFRFPPSLLIKGSIESPNSVARTNRIKEDRRRDNNGIRKKNRVFFVFDEARRRLDEAEYKRISRGLARRHRPLWHLFVHGRLGCVLSKMDGRMREKKVETMSRRPSSTRTGELTNPPLAWVAAVQRQQTLFLCVQLCCPACPKTWSATRFRIINY